MNDVCPSELHERHKSSLKEFAARTERCPMATSDLATFPGVTLVMRNCRQCGSTLAFQLWPKNLITLEELDLLNLNEEVTE